MHIAITEASIEKANAQFWEQMLSMRLEPMGVTDLRCIGSEHVLGSCGLSGAWSGRVEIRLSKGLALQATAAMMMETVESVHAGDLLDAVKEIANMIAGTLKSALPRPCAMSVPRAETVVTDFCILPRTGDSVTVFFRHPAGELMIRVWEETLQGIEIALAFPFSALELAVASAM